MKVTINMTEGFYTWISREAFTIDTQDYPELQGMTKEEVISYIEENSDSMMHNEWDQTMWDAAQEMDVLRDKITDDEYNLNVEVEDDDEEE